MRSIKTGVFVVVRKGRHAGLEFRVRRTTRRRRNKFAWGTRGIGPFCVKDVKFVADPLAF